MDELLTEFQSESKSLVGQLLEILESIEGDYSQHKRLEEYGQIVDRIMGTAKSLAGMVPDLKAVMEAIGNYGDLCKTVSYKASQVTNNEGLYTVVVALLLDATEMLQDMIANLSDSRQLDMKAVLSKTFLDRLRWVSKQFGEGLRGTLQSGETLSQNSIDDLLKALGV